MRKMQSTNTKIPIMHYKLKKQHKHKNNKKTFNYIDFILGFDFCNKDEKRRLYNVLRESWEWANQPIETDCNEVVENKIISE